MPLNSFSDTPLSIIPTEDTAREDYSPQTTMSEKYMMNLGFGDLLKSGMERDSLITQGKNAYDDSIKDEGVELDESFDEAAKEEYWNTHLAGSIHEKMKDSMLDRAMSAKHLENMYQDYYEESARLRYLEEQPWYTDVGIGIMAELTNVPARAALIGGAIGLFPEVAAVSGTTFVAGAVTAGTAGAILEGVKDNIGHQDKNKWDYLSAVALDGMMGGMFRKMKSPFADTQARYIMANAGIDEKTLKQIKKAKSTAERNDIISSAYQKHTGDIADETILDALDRSAKQVHKNTLQKGWQALRQDMAYITGSSRSETMSRISKEMFPDGTLANEVLDRPALAATRTRIEESMRGIRQQMFGDKLKEFSRSVYDDSGILGVKVNSTVEDTFSDILGRIQLDRNINGTSIEKAVEKAMLNRGIASTNKRAYDVLVASAKSMSELANTYHAKLAEEGHIDFKPDADGKSKIAMDDTYTPFVYDKSSFSRLSNAGLESKDFIDFFKNAMTSKNGKLDSDVLNKVATQFYHAISGEKLQNTGTINQILDQMVRNAKGNKEEIELIESLMQNPIKKGVSEEAVSTSSRARTNIDYTYRQSFKTAEGKEVELSFEELLSKDYIGNMDAYARKMSGATVLQKVKFRDRVQMTTKAEAEEFTYKTPEYQQAVADIKERDDAIKELFERKDEFALFDNIDTPEYTAIYNLAKDMGIKTDDIAKQIDDIVDTLGIDKDALNINEINYIVKTKAEIERLREVASQSNLEARLNKVVQEGMDKSGYIPHLREDSFKLGEALRKEAQDMKASGGKQRLLKESDEILEKIKDDYPKDWQRIKAVVQAINGKYTASAKLSHKEAEKIFAKELKKNPDTARSYDDIFKERMEANKPDVSVQNKEIDDIFEKATYKEEDVSIKSAKDYERLRTKVSKELEEAVAKGELSVKDAKKDLTRLDTIYRDFSGVSTSVNPTSNANRFYRIGHSYNIGRLLGQTFFTMPAEAMNVVWDSGIRNMLSSSKALGDLMRAYKNGKLTRPDLIEIQESLGLYDEFLSGTKIFEFDHELAAMHNKIDGSKGLVDKVEGFGQAFAEFTLMMGGVKPLTAIFQTAHVQGVFKRMSAVAKGGNQNTAYKKMIRELGLSERMAGRVYEQINMHSADGLMNFKNWDVEVKNIFLDGVKNRSDTLVQVQRLGDKMAWVNGDDDFMLKDTVMGKIGMELKQFILTAYVKQLGRAVNRADMHIVGLMASQMAVLTLSYMAKQQYNYAGNPEKLEQAMSPERVAAGTLGMMPQGSVLPMLLGLGSSMVTGENVFGNRHSAGATDVLTALPMVDLTNKLAGIFTTPYNMYEEGVQTKDFKDLASVIGLSNNVMTKPLWEAGLDKGTKKSDMYSNRF